MTESFRLDVHLHILPPFYMDAVTAAGVTRSKGKAYPDWSEDLSLRVMDAHAIKTGITSISTPHVHFGDNSKARDLARRCNDFAADMQSRRPDRFGTFAVLPLPDIDGACREAIYALDDADADGVVVLASYGEEFFGGPKFDPLFDLLNSRNAVVFVHPTQHPESKKLPLDLPLFVAEYPLNTTRCALNLMTKRVPERFPNIKFVLAHAGGVLPFLAWRLAIPRVPAVWESDVHDKLKGFWYDIALAAGKSCLLSVKEIAAPERILFGTDWPYTSETTVQWTVRDSMASGLFTPREQADVNTNNALALFPRLAAMEASIAPSAIGQRQ
jgi:predicted TIM-barrel fold metal-dependent hydrolase